MRRPWAASNEERERESPSIIKVQVCFHCVCRHFFLCLKIPIKKKGEGYITKDVFHSTGSPFVNHLLGSYKFINTFVFFQSFSLLFRPSQQQLIMKSLRLLALIGVFSIAAQINAQCNCEASDKDCSAACGKIVQRSGKYVNPADNFA